MFLKKIEENNIKTSYNFSKEMEIIKNIQLLFKDKEEIHDFLYIFIQEIDRKIYICRQQDLIKNILNPEKFITINYIIDKLVEFNMKCYYCECEMFILYKNIKEQSQWTINKTNIYNGYNKDNIVLSCLECNIKNKNNKIFYNWTK